MASQSPPTQSPSHEVRAFQIFIIIPSHAEPAIHRTEITWPVSLRLHSLHPTRYVPSRFSSLFRLMQNLLFIGANGQQHPK